MNISEAPALSSDYDRLWTETYGDLQRLGPAHFHARRLAKRLLRNLSYQSVLDVGSGPGWNMDLLSAGRKLADFVGVDISPEAVRQAQQLVLGGEFLVHDIQTAPLHGRWDLVYAGLMIHLVPDDRAALRNLRQNTGNYLLISTMAGDFERHQQLEQRLGALRNYRAGELEQKLAQAGFRVRQAIYWGFPFFSPFGRWLQDRSGTGTGSYPWGTRLMARLLTGLYYLNSDRRGDLLTILAEVLIGLPGLRGAFAPGCRDQTYQDAAVEDIDISVVIPVYRPAATLPLLTQRLLQVLKSTGKRFEIVFVDDGCPEHSWEILCTLQRVHPEQIVAIQLMRNYGQHNALMCGFRHCRGDVIVSMDDDLQHPPEEIPKLLEALESTGLDLVYGCYNGKKHRAWRNLGSLLAYTFFRIVFHSRVNVTSFRAMRRQLVLAILTYTLNFTYIDGLLAWNTERIGEVVVNHRARFAGRSSYSLSKLLALTLNLFTNFSLLPLQLVAACGWLSAAVGFLLACYYLAYSWLWGIPVAGYASTIVIVLLLGGVQLLSLGIMGEYLGRVHLNINRKPQYVERRVSAENDRKGPS